MKPVVFIHTNDKQMLGALVSAHSYRRNSRDPGAFDVRVLRAEDFPELQEKGRTFLRDGHERAWESRRPSIIHAGPLRDSRRDGAPGRRSRHRSRRLRGRRRCRAFHPRFEGQGDLVPPEAWLRQDHRSSRDLRHASRLLETRRTGRSKTTSRRCGITGSTISTGSISSARTSIRSGCSSRSGTISIT